jgi:transcriptional regulator with PAS, ATPase and Fis domain
MTAEEQRSDSQPCDEVTPKARAQCTSLVGPELRARKSCRFSRIVGRAPAIERVFHIIERVAPTNATVLITGRTGTGKELVAREIHVNSARAAKSFVDVNCAALPEQLVEAELFGHQKGAFTGATETKKGLFEVAHGGTLFLDEVHALRPDLQAKLLRALQERVIRRVGARENLEVDVRVLAASNQDIVEAVRTGEFREDLFYRLNVVPIHLPELRERRGDIPLLVDHFLKRHARANDGEARDFSNEAMQLLVGYDWPGNVRELENAIEYAVAMGSDSSLTIADLPPHLGGTTEALAAAEPLRGAPTLEEVERRYILQALEAAHGNHVRAAEILGIDRRTIYRKLETTKLEGTGEGHRRSRARAGSRR